MLNKSLLLQTMMSLEAIVVYSIFREISSNKTQSMKSLQKQ